MRKEFFIRTFVPSYLRTFEGTIYLRSFITKIEYEGTNVAIYVVCEVLELTRNPTWGSLSCPIPARLIPATCLPRWRDDQRNATA